MKETILLYNLDSAAIRNKIKFLCIQGGIHIRVVEKNQYDVPIGTLAFGKKEDMELYLRSENSEEKPSFNDPMLVFAGFTGQKLMSSAYLRMTGNRGDELAFYLIVVILLYSV